VRRLLAKWQLVYPAMEARRLSSLPLATRRQVARAVEQDPGIDAMAISEGSVVVIQCKSARREVNKGLRRLSDASRMAESDPEVMGGTAVYKGTRIPVRLVADMLAQRASVEEILDCYPSLTREKIELATIYVTAFPRKGRPAIRPRARREPRRTTRQRLTSG